MEYNDYKNQKPNEAAPKAIKELDPIVAMRQIMIHVLPPNFQKVRTYGIMTKSKSEKVKINIPELIKENGQTIRTLFQIVKALLQIPDEEEIKCVSCQSTESEIEIIKPNAELYNKHIRRESRNKSPAETPKIVSIHPNASSRPGISMRGIDKNKVK
ncbi:MAG: transposase [Saprospiraceae bacterium]|nr:transposase [Saprospiraceae bacterium]